jgi:glycosyltransferase involved in cell wall biosynthesis
MRLLVISPNPPTPPYSGTRRRLFELLRALGDHNRIDLACLVQSHADQVQLERLRIRGVSIHGVRLSRHQFVRPAAGRWPPLIERHWSERFSESVATLVDRDIYDWVLADECYVSAYLHGLSARKVLTEHNVEYRILEQIAGFCGDLDLALHMTGSRREKIRKAREELSGLRKYERDVWREVDLCVTVSEPEARIMAAVVGDSRVHLAPNCPGEVAPAGQLRPGPPGIVFIGKLNYFPNVDAVVQLVEEIIPRVRRSWPRTDVVVAGREPTRALVDFCRGAGVRVAANPERMDQVLTSGSILVSPVRFGGGTRIKVLDAFSLGVPVVASDLTVEGLDIVAGLQVRIAAGPDQFAAEVSHLLGAPAERAELAEAGRDYLRSRTLSWGTVFADLERRLRAGL